MRLFSDFSIDFYAVIVWLDGFGYPFLIFISLKEFKGFRLLMENLREPFEGGRFFLATGYFWWLKYCNGGRAGATN